MGFKNRQYYRHTSQPQIQNVPRRLEHEEQRTFFTYVRLKAQQYPEYKNVIAIPNGAHLANGAISYRRLEAEGLSKGFLDIFCFVPRGDYHGLAIEMKIKPNKPSPEQNDWIIRLSNFGYLPCIAWSALEAIHILDNYLLQDD